MAQKFVDTAKKTPFNVKIPTRKWGTGALKSVTVYAITVTEAASGLAWMLCDRYACFCPDLGVRGTESLLALFLLS